MFEPAAMHPLRQARTALAAAVSELGAAPSAGRLGSAGSLADARGQVALLAELRAVVDGLLALAVGELDRQGLAAEDGLATTRSWLRARLRLADDEAARLVGLARAAERVPATAAALCAGELHAAHLRVIDRSLRDVQDPAARGECEALLLREAAHNDARELDARVGQRLREIFRPEVSVTEPEQLRDARRFHAARTLWGTVDVHGTLDPANGEAFLAAFGPLVRPLPDDHRTAGQRGADALGELARRVLSEGSLGEVGGERPHVVVTVDVARLSARGGGAAGAGLPADLPADLPSDLPSDLAAGLAAVPDRPAYAAGGDADWASLLALCCDAAITRLVLGPRRAPLEIGWKSRVWTPAQRRAIVLRDRHCTWPGCRRPAAYCDIDHIRCWQDGGPTDVDNGRLLCGFHHQLRHDGWELTGTHGDWRASPPPDWGARLARRRRRRRRPMAA